MATVKKATKAKNLSAGPSKKTKIAGPVDPQGKWTGIQERTLGNMKKGGKVKKANFGDALKSIAPIGGAVAGLFGKAMGANPMGAINSMMKKGGKVEKAKDGKWMQKAAASIKKRGTEGKCTPITKPGCTGKAKVLAKTFKKIAKARKGK